MSKSIKANANYIRIENRLDGRYAMRAMEAAEIHQRQIDKLNKERGISQQK